MLSPKQSPFVLKIDKSTSASALTALLYKNHLIQHPKLYLMFIKINGWAPKLKAGYYQVEKNDSAMHLLNKIVDGDVITSTFSIIEGTNQKQVSQRLAMAPYLLYQENDWRTIKGKYASAEGLLLADSYEYEAGSDAKILLQKAHDNLESYLNFSWANRSPNLPYQSPYQLLIAASIIEKESARSDERRLISGIIVNRLRKNMLLQMDPTVIYALDSEYKGSLSHADLKINSPFNTYLHRGLPPSPIAMVGKEAIDAAAHPAQTNYLYFVAKGDGSHYFSVNYEQQKEAIMRFIRKKP